MRPAVGHSRLTILWQILMSLGLIYPVLTLDNIFYHFKESKAIILFSTKKR